MNPILSIDQEYVAHTYARFPMEIVRGEGSELYDETGKKYIDLGSGIAVNIFGVADRSWAQAVSDQLLKVQHTSNLYYTEPCALLAKAVCERTGMKKVFFGNSGAEANECAIKAARRYSVKKYGEGRSTIITLKNSFHGRTLATLAATGQDGYHQDFGPFPGGFVYAEADQLESVKTLAKENRCCAVMIETIQGEGGVVPLSDGFVKGLRQFCDENDLLLIVDEVQTGNGRTGALYSYMNYDIKPDIFTTAKGIGGGLPIGLAVLGEKCQDALAVGSHGSTFGGNPVCCAGALNIFSRLTDTLLDEVNAKSAYIVETLSALPEVKKITGKGLMLGIACQKNGREIADAALQKGLLVLTAKDKVRLLPALNIPWPILQEGVDILVRVIREVCAQ